MTLETTHRFVHGDARAMPLEPNSVDLIVTSPPYPMIKMWDECFSSWNASIRDSFDRDNLWEAYDKIHSDMRVAWEQCHRMLKPGGILCVNIGDATRNTSAGFRIFNNHSQVIHWAEIAGLTPLPDIIWSKPSCSPNKFLGSGMLPCGAYVTYEHEYVLIFRKGKAREFKTVEDKELRAKSAYFWEERNIWFSDIWKIPGARQGKGGERTGAFPLEIPYRLINMFSCIGDTVLDPFAGTGTTARATIACGRNSISVEMDQKIFARLSSIVGSKMNELCERTARRLEDHLAFAAMRGDDGRPLRHMSVPYWVPVATGQEEHLELSIPNEVQKDAQGNLSVSHVRAEFPK